MSDVLRIAVIGSGAVGSYYGARLAEAGHRVHFLMRRDFQAVRSKGLKITSPDGDITLVSPNIARQSAEIGPVDWVICALKSTSIDEARRLVEPCVETGTRILVLMNGLGIEEKFSEWFGPQRIFGGLAFTCINRGDPGCVNHMAYGQLTIGHFQDNQKELKNAVNLWTGCKVKILEANSLRRARWEKLCWNIPFNGLAITAGGITTDRIVGAPGLRREARDLMNEVISIGNADLKFHGEDVQIDRDGIITRMFALTDTMGVYRPSTMIDFVEGKPMEVEAIFGEPLRRAEVLKVASPKLTLLTALVRALNRRRV